MLRNRLRFVRKNYPRRVFAAATAYWFCTVLLKFGKRLLRFDVKGLHVLSLAVKHALFPNGESLLPVLEKIRPTSSAALTSST
jgi:hypothetical protein